MPKAHITENTVLAFSPGEKVARPKAVTDEGATTGSFPKYCPLIPPSVRTGVPSPRGGRLRRVLSIRPRLLLGEKVSAKLTDEGAMSAQGG